MAVRKMALVRLCFSDTDLKLNEYIGVLPIIILDVMAIFLVVPPVPASTTIQFESACAPRFPVHCKLTELRDIDGILKLRAFWNQIKYM